jgi:hypothetical protein
MNELQKDQARRKAAEAWLHNHQAGRACSECGERVFDVYGVMVVPEIDTLGKGTDTEVTVLLVRCESCGHVRQFFAKGIIPKESDLYE